MCGIIGAAGNIGTEGERAVKNMLYMDQLRGVDSTGLVTVAANSNKVEYYKRAVLAYDFLQLSPVMSMFTRFNRAYIGHNRAATKGSVSSVNAHPFIHGSIIGVHNGTLRNQSLLPDHEDFEVDSDNVFYSIDKIGIEETHKKLCGAYALVWYDAEKDTLNMIRNDERDLYYALTEKEDAIYWASEKHMLLAALTRNKIAWKSCQMVPEHMLISVDVSIAKKTTAILDRTEMKRLEAYQPPKLVKSSRGGSHPKAVPAKKHSSTISKEGLTRFGLTLSSKVNFAPYETRKGVLVGYELDHGIKVHIHCNGPEQANSLLKLSDDGNYLILNDIDFYSHPKGRNEKGIINGKFKNCDYSSWDDYNYEGQMSSLIAANEEEEDEEDELEEATFVDNRGEFLTEVQFNDRYKCCSFCTDVLDYHDTALMPITHNECLCGSCSQDETVMSSCNMLGGMF